jgi:hypothetical protein
MDVDKRFLDLGIMSRDGSVLGSGGANQANRYS